MKVLIIRFSSIGDIVLTTPVVRALKQQLGAEVHYLTKKGFQGIVAANPNITKVYAIEQKVSEVLPALKEEGYDYLIDLHHNLRSLQVKLALKGKAYAFDKLNWEKWLMVKLKKDRLPKKHIVDRYMETVQPLGVKNDGQGLDYFIPEEDEVEVGNFLSTNVLAASQEVPRFVAFAIGAAHNTKRLPTDKIISICRKISLPVVLLGGPGESEEGGQIVEQAGGHVFNACGLLNLNQSASFVRQAYKVISHDTGLMHIAAAFGKDIISVWGNTIPEFGMYPYFPEGMGHNTTMEVKGLSCRPCSKIGYEACPKGHFRCMRNISEESIVSVVER
ncbi:MAG: glycosyltransferase family 9 protein [Phaeodactylibacter sp.]|nr:glycosyltransferase family 9 protein [Phaeodactylibacter sp.]MCB9299766.1 glycosyltransferase family 9 protein [Lewinellaceae bacterium]HQU59712.1 glycosyltransferase family 9 protein [Saprospiraceae bacterium]